MFLQSLSALIAAPAVPAAVLAGIPAASAAPKLTVAQQLWASYFSSAKGQQAMAAVQQGGQVTARQAQKIVMRSVAQARSPMALIAKPAVTRVSQTHIARQAKLRLPQQVQTPADTVPDILRHLRDPVACNCDPHGAQIKVEKDTP